MLFLFFEATHEKTNSVTASRTITVLSYKIWDNNGSYILGCSPVLVGFICFKCIVHIEKKGRFHHRSSSAAGKGIMTTRSLLNMGPGTFQEPTEAIAFLTGCRSWASFHVEGGTDIHCRRLQQTAGMTGFGGWD